MPRLWEGWDEQGARPDEDVTSETPGGRSVASRGAFCGIGSRGASVACCCWSACCRRSAWWRRRATRHRLRWCSRSRRSTRNRCRRAARAVLPDRPRPTPSAPTARSRARRRPAAPVVSRARPCPGRRCPDGSIPSEATAPAGCLFGPPGPPDPGTTVCPDGSTPRDRSADRALRNILGLDDGSDHPLKAYDIGCDEGSWNAFLRKMWCAAQSLPFAIGKWFIGIGTEMLTWALEFRVADTPDPGGGDAVAGLRRQPRGSPRHQEPGMDRSRCSSAAGTSCAPAGRTAPGTSPLTFLIAIFGGMVLANPEGYLEGSVDMAQATSGAVLESVDGAVSANPGQDADAVRDRLAGVLRRSFVAEPYDLINWGESLDGECAAARDQILDSGPVGRRRPAPRDHAARPAARSRPTSTTTRPTSGPPRR